MSTGTKRTKTGCITCRIRRVKCDEARPNCERCSSTGRTCDGYSTLPFSRRDLQAASKSNSPQQRTPSPFPNGAYNLNPISKLVTDPAFSDVLEKRYFQFFRHRTVISTNSMIDSRFWDRTVPQACHSVPAIKHAILALASWHQLSNSPNDLQHRYYADRQYQLALQEAKFMVSSAKESDVHDVDKLLIACIVFICFEGVRGDYAASALHMDNGRAICKQYAKRLRSSGRRNDLVEIQQALARLDLPAVAFSDVSSPYHYTLEDFLDTDPVLMPWQFQDVAEAKVPLIDLSRMMLVIGHYLDRAYFKGDDAEAARLQAEKDNCAERIELWKKYFDQVAHNANPDSRLLVLNLQQWYHGIQAVSKAESVGPETRWDAVNDHFTAIVEIGEKIIERLLPVEGEISFSYDLGYTISTFLTATRCRDPQIRRRALAILRAIPRQEGVWASLPAAAIAERWMRIEEEGLTDLKKASDVPECKRVQFIETAVYSQETRAKLQFTLSGGTEVRSETIFWKAENRAPMSTMLDVHYTQRYA
ncbi:Aspercryptin biosynthesis cluster-specific transcription regulator atnN [Pseudocercospora fuligena]|uniref:Aspercryptin biosynthesis cluster-specific transcription regulator atnN n=1 Tax=Pseudocercospora fuligena TaxID=685502 RepID=A0A8H6RVP7_9PEZI|nr:Aspercryptin biosynthesis cluster-specific transcription regulator atnN [Pseudocercospora fuligena]